MSEKSRDSKIYKKAQEMGFMVRKSRAKNWSVDDQQMYMLLDGYSGSIIEGFRFDMSLDAIEEFLNRK